MKLSDRTKKLVVVVIVLMVVGTVAGLVGMTLKNILFSTVPVNGSSSENIVIGDDTVIFFEEPRDYGHDVRSYVYIYDEGIGDVSIVTRGDYQYGRKLLYGNVSWTLIVTNGGYVLYITEVK